MHLACVSIKKYCVYSFLAEQSSPTKASSSIDSMCSLCNLPTLGKFAKCSWPPKLKRLGYFGLDRHFTAGITIFYFNGIDRKASISVFLSTYAIPY